MTALACSMDGWASFACGTPYSVDLDLLKQSRIVNDDASSRHLKCFGVSEARCLVLELRAADSMICL
jgi:hypothetical protein